MTTTKAELGYFTLGEAVLGQQPIRGDAREEITITENVKAGLHIYIRDSIFFVETLLGKTYAFFSDEFTISDAVTYLSEYLAGAKGIITQALDLTATDFCSMVQESGQQIDLNGSVERAYVFTKQTSQNFDIGTKILPGDAVMFTCPLLAVAVGDIVTWDGKMFRVADNINHYFANTIIYVKHALQRIRYTVPVPQVIGLVASENLTGKTTLTWIEVDFETFDHYEIWESVADNAGPFVITGVPLDGPGNIMIQTNETYVAGKYLAGQKITVQGSAGMDGEYTIVAYQDNGGKDEIIINVPAVIDNSAPHGNVVNLSHYWKKDTTKSNGLSIKNLAQNVMYFYLVRAVDKYGNPGWWSNEAATPVNATKPPTPEGLR